MLDYVKKIEGEDKEKRRKAILSILRKEKINFILEEFSHFGYSGTNIIIQLKKGEKEILVTSHYDVVRGPGANDNASAIAVQIGLAKKLRRKKLKHGLKLIIFDWEEVGNVGAKAYIKKRGMKNILAVLDMEMVGWGELIGVWPTKNYEDSSLLATIRKVCKNANYREAKKIPLFWATYSAFRAAGLKDAFCFTLVPKKQEKEMRAFIEKPLWLSIILLMTSTIKIPEFFVHYHSDSDTSKHLSEKSLQLMRNTLEKVIIKL